MASYNHCTLIGNLTRDPETRYAASGTAVVSITLAVNRVWKNDQGEKQEEVSFIDCSAFGRTAEVVAEYVRKGQPLLVDGRIKQNTWEDKKTGEKRSKLGVVVERIVLLGGGGGGSGGGNGGGKPAQERPAQKPASKPTEEDSPADMPKADDDVPF